MFSARSVRLYNWAKQTMPDSPQSLCSWPSSPRPVTISLHLLYLCLLLLLLVLLYLILWWYCLVQTYSYEQWDLWKLIYHTTNVITIALLTIYLSTYCSVHLYLLLFFFFFLKVFKIVFFLSLVLVLQSSLIMLLWYKVVCFVEEITKAKRPFKVVVSGNSTTIVFRY